MEIKKLLLTGSCAMALSLLGACSGDTSSGASSDEPTSSSNGDIQSSANENGPSSSNSDGGNSSPATTSSSSIADSDDPQMACSEIMYNAADGSTLEWIEIYIAGGMDMDNMSNFDLHLSGAVDFNFPEESFKKGEYIVVTNDTAAFRSTYKGNIRIFQWDGGSSVKLSNEGDVVNVKVSGEGDVSCAFGNEPPWPSLADGKGHTLVYLGGNAAQPNSWAASDTVGGRPGVGNDKWLKPASVRINEIMPNIGQDPAWIELYNTGSEEVDVEGWTLEVKRRKQTLTIKSGTVSTKIPAKGYVVLDAVDNFINIEDPDKSELVVSPEGGEFYLHGKLEGEESSIWVPAGTGTSGVVDLSDGSTAQGPLAKATKNEKNSALQIGSVYINEIHYHPNESSSIPFEFMELVNSSDNDITLYNATMTKGWRIEGVGLDIPNIVIPGKGMILLIPEALDPVVMENAHITNWGPDLVRSTYNIADNVQIITYPGKLSNRSETIAVKEPYKKEESKSAASGYAYFYIWHDATLYSDNWPSLADADGFGYSLQRKDISTMGYEASAWTAAEPTPGK